MGRYSRHIAALGFVALRANALGFTVAQFDFVRPVDRPQKGWMFQFSLSPGF
jgi:hypothetical protein